MKYVPNDPPRVFTVGETAPTEMRDCGRIALDADEQVTFVTESGNEYDVARKSWGFYATPSLNGRLRDFHLRPALLKNAEGRYYLVLVEEGHEADFEEYVRDENQQVVCWLDTTEALRRIDQPAGDA